MNIRLSCGEGLLVEKGRHKIKEKKVRAMSTGWGDDQMAALLCESLSSNFLLFCIWSMGTKVKKNYREFPETH